MGNGISSTIQDYIVNFDNVNKMILAGHTIIHVMPPDQEKYLIKNTLTADKEIEIINQFINNSRFDKIILIYGKNVADYNIILQRRQQLKNLGFIHVYIYVGGLFEWLLLQELYGANNFPTSALFQGNVMDYKNAEIEVQQ